MRRRFIGAKRLDAETRYHDRGLDELAKKLRAWLMQQPEWVAVLSADRHTRKRYGILVADLVTRIPAFVQVSKPVPRLNIRRASADDYMDALEREEEARTDAP